MAKSHTIAVAGKGGVGKTTTCGMIIDYLCKAGKGPLLVVDADANSNLNEVLGVEVETTLGDIREEMARAEQTGSVPANMTKADYAEMKFGTALIEEDDYDMLVMGRTQGKGCYCFVNGVLKTQLDKYIGNYNYVIMDNEAGLESVMYNISNIVIQVFVNNLGTDTVAAWGTLGKIDALFWMVINAFAISITTFVGQNFGAGKYHRMRKSVSVCMVMSMVSSAVMIILMYSFAPWIYRLFTTDSAVIVHGVHMSRFLLPSYFIYVIIGILSGALRGTGKVLVPMLLTCGGVCSLRILWLFTAGQMYPGINTIMLSYPVSWSITAVLFIVYYFMKFPGKKKEN